MPYKEKSRRQLSRAKDTHSVRGHGHGKDVDDLAPPVRLEHIARKQTVINSYNASAQSCSKKVLSRHIACLKHNG